MAGVSLGAFELAEPIGSGGMGTVWRGRHRASGTPVAVKFLKAADSWSPLLLELFQTEVRAVAALNHPAIVLVLDSGAVTPAEAEASGGALRARTPYLVTELATGGTLSRLRGRLGWPLLRPLLLTLLDALAHAHARGVIHRDLKPANVLVPGADDLRPGVKITDFGVARLADEESADLFVGSPTYAPPEQLYSRQHLLGPGTDLYALGCLTWDLVCGGPPWRGGVDEIAERKLRGELPAWAPANSVPDALRGWLATCLEPRPARRFSCAADAAWALRALPDAPTLGLVAPPELSALDRQSGDPRTAHGPPEALPTALDDVATRIDAEGLTRLGAAPLATVGPDDDARPHRGPSRPPLPEDWRRRDPPAPPMPLVGAGLGLYSLRSLPLVDRNPERDALWAALHDITRTGAPQAVLLRGPSGVGKSRLVQWIGERAEELGAATVFVARHGRTPGRADGLGPMLARALRCVGLRGAERSRRARSLLTHLGNDDPWLEAAVVSLVAPDAAEAAEFARPRERHEAIVRLLAMLAEDRPVLLWLDDLQWAGDALALLEHLLTRRRAPILAVATVRDGELAPGSSQGARIDALPATALTLQPLEPVDQRALVGTLLRLDASLRDEVVERSGGNPLFAVQLVGDWVRRGILVPGDDGFERAAGARAHIPDDIHALWTARFAEALGDRVAARHALELGAALGEEVLADEWRALCTEAGLVRVGDLPRELADRGLLHVGARTWRFIHAMARESIERTARESGRWPGAHAVCARRLLGAPGPEAAERRGRHHLEADAWANAITDLGTAAEAWLRRGELHRARAVHALTERALVSVDGSDPRRLRHRLLHQQIERGLTRGADIDELAAIADAAEALDLGRIQADAQRELGINLRDRRRLDDAIEQLRQSVALAEDLDYAEAEGRSLASLGFALQMTGEGAEARQLLRRGVQVAMRLNDPGLLCTCYGGLAMAYRQARRLDRAAEFVEREIAVATDAADTLLLAQADVHAASVHGERDEPERTLAHLASARQRFGRLAAEARLVDVLSLEGSVHRRASDWSAARASYAEALAIDSRPGSAHQGFHRANLALVALGAGDLDEARTQATQARAVFEDGGRGVMVDLMDLLLLVPAAATGTPPLGPLLERAEAAADGWKRYEPDVARALERAAALAGGADAERLAALRRRYESLRPG